MGTTSFDQFDVRQRPNRIRPQLAEILQMLGGSKRRHHKQTLAGLTESAGLGFFGLGVHSEWRGFNANCDSEVVETDRSIHLNPAASGYHDGSYDLSLRKRERICLLPLRSAAFLVSSLFASLCQIRTRGHSLPPGIARA